MPFITARKKIVKNVKREEEVKKWLCDASFYF